MHNQEYLHNLQNLHEPKNFAGFVPWSEVTSFHAGHTIPDPS